MRSCPSMTDVDPAYSGVKNLNSVVPLLLCTLVYYLMFNLSLFKDVMILK